jgi:hypothetical protein
VGFKSVLAGRRSPGFSLADKYDDWIGKKAGEWKPRDVGWFHPSSSSGCMRRVAFGFLGVAPDAVHADGRGNRIFGNGHGVHYRIQKELEEMGVLLQKELPFESERYLLRGHTDGLLDVPELDNPLLEIKSINAAGFVYVYKAPRDSHVDQSTCYMLGLKKKNCILLYENKDNQDWRQHVVEYSKVRMKEINKRFKGVLAKVRERALPDKAGPKATSYPCRMGKGNNVFYCPHVERCQKRKVCLTQEEWEQKLDALPDVTKDRLKKKER